MNTHKQTTTHAPRINDVLPCKQNRFQDYFWIYFENNTKLHIFFLFIYAFKSSFLCSFNKLLLQKEELEQKHVHLLQVVESEKTAKWQYTQQCEELSTEIKKLRNEVRNLVWKQYGSDVYFKHALYMSSFTSMISLFTHIYLYIIYSLCYCV